MEQTIQVNEQQLEQKKIIKKGLSKVFWTYQLGCGLSNSYERLQSLVFCAPTVPAIKKLYTDDEEQQREALKRYLNFFNTEGTVGAFIQGITVAMEEEKSSDTAVSGTVVTSIKAGLMDPLAGISDSTTRAAPMPLIISIFIPMTKGGNVIGGIGPLALYTAITSYISQTLMNKSYTLRRNLVLSLSRDGKIKQVIYSANVLGMMMMGALSTSYIKIVSSMTLRVTDGVTIVLQDILDQIMKGLLPLAAIIAIYFFVIKKDPRCSIIIDTITLINLVISFFGLL